MMKTRFLKHITLSVIASLLLIATTGETASRDWAQDVLYAIRILQPSRKVLTDNQAEELTRALVSVSRYSPVRWQTLLAIAFYESSLDFTAKGKTSDYGLMQIHISNIRRKGMDKSLLLKDPTYSLLKAAELLAYNKSRYQRRTIHWVGYYNTGRLPKVIQYSKKIKQIEKRIDKAVRLSRSAIK